LRGGGDPKLRSLFASLAQLRLEGGLFTPKVSPRTFGSAAGVIAGGLSYDAAMPEPQADPNLPQVRRVAAIALGVGAALTFLKLAVYWVTDSVAVLSDALESIINVAAAGVMLYSITHANRPADADHPYGHGKLQFLAVGLEGWLILLAGVVIAVEAVGRLFAGTGPSQLGFGLVLLGVVGVLDAVLAGYVWQMGQRYQNDLLLADGRHLATDVASTVGVLIGLGLVRATGWWWLDPIVALLMAGLIGAASWRLLWHSVQELMDRRDPADDRLIRAILDEAVEAGDIAGYHKLRHRHAGAFHWVDMHLHVDGQMTVKDGHALASRIEHRIEQALGQANATAHLEPPQAQATDEPAGRDQDTSTASEGETRDADSS
jgi:cation diffusion facilitator family transporter